MFLFAIILVSCSLTQCSLATKSDPLTHKIFLDGNRKFSLGWSLMKHNITFEVQVEGAGYVGIGFSSTGGMKASDILLLWIDKIGVPHLSDRFSVGNEEPRVDLVQDYTLLRAFRNETHLTFRFTRKYDSYDYQDYDLSQDNTVKVIWSMSDKVPHVVMNGKWSFDYHGENRGTKSLYLLNHQEIQIPQSPDVKQLDVLTRNVTISDKRHTIYMCHIEALPKTDKKNHIIGFTPVIENLQHVHHMVAFECEVDPLELEQFSQNDSVECYSPNMPSEWNNCHSTIFSWAVGSEGEMFPENVGVPFGGKNHMNYILLEVHYDNPHFKKGIVDKSGLRFYYTDQLREFDAGIFMLGHMVGNWQLIPPGFENFTVVAPCDTSKVPQHIPKEGIKILSVMLHSHILGKAMFVHHVRKGQNLPNIAQDNNYDYNYQQSKRVTNKTILPGDQIITKCVYDSTKRKRITWGGQSTQQEMCVSFLMYYPKINLRACLSHPSIEAYEDAFNIKAKDISNGNNSLSFTSYYIDKPKELENRSVRVYAQKLIDKKPKVFEKLQQNFLSSKFTHNQFCILNKGNDSEVKIEKSRVTIHEKEENKRIAPFYFISKILPFVG